MDFKKIFTKTNFKKITDRMFSDMVEFTVFIFLWFLLMIFIGDKLNLETIAATLLGTIILAYNYREKIRKIKREKEQKEDKEEDVTQK